MMPLPVFLCLLVCCFLQPTTEAFSVVPNTNCLGSICRSSGGGRASTSALFALSHSELLAIGYSATVPKPLGVVFGENEAPFSGLALDDVEPGLNGGKAGLRTGDQLLAVNGENVVGQDFDTVMEKLRSAEGTLDLTMFRGNVKSLYVILDNMGSAMDGTSEAEGDVSDEPVVLDENYETPVVIDVSEFEDKPLSLGDVFKAAKKVGQMLTEETEEEKAAAEARKKQQNEKKSGGFLGGLFGGGETIQLDGDEASGLKGQSRRKD
eukprot:CAMPEP_0194047546 /NCGR_PEP_ID=MMETSP0009_2-20130614/25030_1 /TAXON_ID=210454 /ORGANISM="Grammatophora oceanica, Strain CCMP 410" /LENGTH=264 /DNA_ID=CAMNT_0038693203 /DNA_START=8 /DNA_END=802 /DNA_ORIENTATION=+